MRYPLLERHPAGAVGGAVLPEYYPGEDSAGRMTIADLQRARRWDSEPSGGDFQRQCDALGVNRWNQDFLADTHNDRLDRFARRSGLVDDDAPNIIIAERARAAADALAVAGAQLRQGDYNQATQRRVHAAFAAYEAAAEFYNPERTSRRNALHAFHSTPPAQRSASWRGAASML
jgi:hypothetical protein